MKFPFQHKYWVIGHYMSNDVIRTFSVRRTRLSPDLNLCETLVDGPFDYQESAARALTFWRLQYERNSKTRIK